jgi:uncharacterized protein YgiB involved in biofilm formation
MKRSRQISLTLLASLSLAACDADEPSQRAVYTSQQACVEDWGDTDNCDDDDHDGSWYGPHYFYHSGKTHYYSKKSGKVMAVPSNYRFSGLGAGVSSPRAAKVVASSISRGGFGGSSSSHGAAS